MAELELVELPGGERELRIDGQPRALLATGAGIEAVNTPKPHIHPLRTPGGVEVTGFAPDDHPWHHGLQFAMPRVDAHNLWGGGTYFSPDEGYRVVEDQGRIEHLAWSDGGDAGAAEVDETLRWVGHGGEPLLEEHRRWTFAIAEVAAVPALVIDFATTLRSATGADVSLQTPAQRGRPDGGYGGLFLRLGEGFGAIDLDGDGVDLSVSGGSSRTMVVHGVTGSGEQVTLGLAFGDQPQQGTRHWLHRFEPFSAIGWAAAYVDALTVPADGSLSFAHRLLVADGHLSPEAVRAVL